MNDFEEDDYHDYDSYDSDTDELQPLYCRKCDYEVLDEDALRCPFCGDYLATGDVWRGRSLWWVVLGFLGIVAVVLALSGF